MWKILQMLKNLLKNVKKCLRFYPTCKITNYPVNFMDAVRRHETPGSEKKDFIIHDTRTARALCFHLFLSVSGFPEVIKRGPKNT